MGRILNILVCAEAIGRFLYLLGRVSNILACVEAFGMFRIYWACFAYFGSDLNLIRGVSDYLLHFNLYIEVLYQLWGAFISLGVFCTYGPP